LDKSDIVETIQTLHQYTDANKLFTSRVNSRSINSSIITSDVS
jgi:hypothetical protein